MKVLHKIAFILLVIGGLNWLLVAFDYNLVDMIFGNGSSIAMIVYVLVGLSALYLIFTHKSDCKNCTVSSGGQPMGQM
jgi:uncharacterized protein